ncbi:MAG: 4-(cytidine 5'-diphospho)-2-C-methyl-D-erythritol kinase [Burkholderiaceae bacterium]
MPAPSPLTVSAPAKLNLFLHVTGRRADGYHLLQSAFQLIDLADTLTFAPRDDGKVSLHLGNNALLAGVSEQDNLITRAALALKSENAASMHLGVDIWLEKRIPLGGGLGGGSSDAATTLLALNKLWKLEFSDQKLAEIGLKLGADVPFFLFGNNAWVEGIGEQLTPLQLPPHWYVVIHPGVHVATPDVFRHPDLTRNTPPAKIEGFAQEILQAGFFGKNDLQNVAVQLAPQVAQALQCLADCGASAARMTGSGACVFAAQDSEEKARVLAQQVRACGSWKEGWQVWVAKGLDRHPAFDQLGLAMAQA